MMRVIVLFLLLCLHEPLQCYDLKVHVEPVVLGIEGETLTLTCSYTLTKEPDEYDLSFKKVTWYERNQGPGGIHDFNDTAVTGVWFPAWRHPDEKKGYKLNQLNLEILNFNKNDTRPKSCLVELYGAWNRARVEEIRLAGATLYCEHNGKSFPNNIDNHKVQLSGIYLHTKSLSAMCRYTGGTHRFDLVIVNVGDGNKAVATGWKSSAQENSAGRFDLEIAFTTTITGSTTFSIEVSNTEGTFPVKITQQIRVFFIGNVEGLTIQVPQAVTGEEQENVSIPCTYQSGYEWSELLWTEKDEDFAHVVYQHYPLPGGFVYDYGKDVSYRSGVAIRYKRSGNNLIINGFNAEDTRTKCCHIYVKVNNGIRGASACAALTFTPGVNECASSPCQHGGTCTDQFRGYSCQCHHLWVGTHCENGVDECASNPCYHGICVDQVGGWTCDCTDTGYKGTLCQTEINECLTYAQRRPCVNGVCKDLVNGFECICDYGFLGTNCEIQEDFCQSNPCVHGTCNLGDGPEGGFYWCACDFGYNGIHCASEIEYCTFPTNRCWNLGTCIELDGPYTKCNCPATHTGEKCKTYIRPVARTHAAATMKGSPPQSPAARVVTHSPVIVAVLIAALLVILTLATVLLVSVGFRRQATDEEPLVTEMTSRPSPGRP